MGMVDGFIPSFPPGFCETLKAPLPPAICSEPRRRQARVTIPPRPPRRSTRLAKKARSCTLALLVVQNVLLKKLNITKDAPPEAADIQAYINKFNQGLTVDEAQLIEELFVDHVPMGQDVAATADAE